MIQINAPLVSRGNLPPPPPQKAQVAVQLLKIKKKSIGQIKLSGGAVINTLSLPLPLFSSLHANRRG